MLPTYSAIFLEDPCITKIVFLSMSQPLQDLVTVNMPM